MSENPRIPMPFGSGLDRETGIMAVRPSTFEDLRNLLLHQGKAVVRPGFGSALALLDDVGNPISHIVAGEPLRSDSTGIIVSYQESTQRVWVHSINADGTVAALVDEWVHDLGGWGSTPPVVHMAESYGNVFMAHDKRSVTSRAKTIYYDTTGSLVDMVSDDWGGRGNEDIRFRGVVRHLNYLFGWGWGDSTSDRPEFVRSSVAGDPTSFKVNHYAIAGNQRDPVLLCKPAGNRLIVFKDSETHVIKGSSRDSFGIKMLDPLYGILGSKLAANFGGLVLAWSAEGPRSWDGLNDSDEIAIPLDLGGLEPSTLVPQGLTETSFAFYVPELRVVIFVFGRRVYALTVRVEGDWKWSYWELGFDPLCAFKVFDNTLSAVAPTGFPEYTSAVEAGTYVDVTVTNRSQDGDETLEAWVQEDPAGAWAKNKSVAVALTSTQVVQLDGLTAGTVYNTAYRYRRGLLYTVGYEVTPPSDWPAVSQGQVTTTIDPPSVFSGVWSRTGAAAEKIVLTVTPATGLGANDIEVFRNAVSIGTISPGSVGTFDDTTALGLTGEADHDYTFVTKGGTDSPPSAALTLWAGPPLQPQIEWAQATGPSYQVGFSIPDPTIPTEVWDNYDDAGGTGASTLRQTASAGVYQKSSGALVNVPVSPGLLILLQVRQKATAFTTDDFSKFSDPWPGITIMDPWI